MPSFFILTGLSSETDCHSVSAGPARRQPFLPGARPTPTNCRTTQSARLCGCGKLRASRATALRLPGLPTRPSAPLQHARQSPVLDLISGRCLSDSVSQTDSNHGLVFRLPFYLLPNATVWAQAPFCLLTPQWEDAKEGWWAVPLAVTDEL